MVDLIGGALLIMMMRICDVTIGTFRTILIVQGRKLLAGTAGFFEVLIWVFAIRFVFQHLDNLANFFGYAVGSVLEIFWVLHLNRKSDLAMFNSI